VTRWSLRTSAFCHLVPRSRLHRVTRRIRELRHHDRFRSSPIYGGQKAVLTSVSRRAAKSRFDPRDCAENSWHGCACTTYKGGKVRYVVGRLVTSTTR
jgi:hypothetical protein